MSAFDRLEARVISLSLVGEQDRPESVVVVGLHKSQPAESHDGTYGQAGEPVRSVVYRRARVTFGPSSTVNGVRQVTNSEPVTITGLEPGTYTHFSLHGSTSAGAT